MGSEPTDAMMDAACEKFAEFGIDFRCPWQCDLDDAELERYEALRAVLTTTLSAHQEEQIERLTYAMQSIQQWSEAYPLTVFPEPDLKKARELLEAGGMTLDAISASAMRHVVEGVGKIARAALEGSKGNG